MNDRYIKFLLVLEQGQVYKPSAATPEKKDRLKDWLNAPINKQYLKLLLRLILHWYTYWVYIITWHLGYQLTLEEFFPHSWPIQDILVSYSFNFFKADAVKNQSRFQAPLLRALTLVACPEILNS